MTVDIYHLNMLFECNTMIKPCFGQIIINTMFFQVHFTISFIMLIFVILKGHEHHFYKIKHTLRCQV